MNKKARIKELEAGFEHLQERIDNLRDYVQEYKCDRTADYYFNKLQSLVALSLKFDKNSEEYQKLSKAVWKMLELYVNALGEC